MKVSAFGEIMMRCCVPDKKKLIQSNTLEYIFSGTGLNVLGQLQRFNIDTRMITRLPVSSLGEAAISHINKLGVDTKKITRGGNFVGVYFLEEGFGKRPSTVTYTDRKNSSFCSASVNDYDIDKSLDGVDMLHFCGISLAMNEDVRNTAYAFAKRAKEKNITVVFDCNYREKLWNGNYEEAQESYEKLLEYTDIVFANEKDIEKIFKILPNNKSSDISEKLKEIVPKFSKKYNLDFVTGTTRESLTFNKQRIRGFAFERDQVYFSDFHDLDIYDRLGGGDAYTAGVLFMHLNGASLDKKVNFGIASSILGHTIYGDTPLSSLQEIEDYLSGEFKELKR